MSRINGFTKVDKIVELLVKKYGLNETDFSLYDIFENEIGPVLGKYIHVAGKKNKALLVRVENSVYHQEFLVKKKEIIKKINECYGEKVIEDIKVV